MVVDAAWRSALCKQITMTIADMIIREYVQAENVGPTNEIKSVEQSNSGRLHAKSCKFIC